MFDFSSKGGRMISDLSEALHPFQKQSGPKVLNYFAILKEGHQP